MRPAIRPITTPERTTAHWSRAGVLFGTPPARRSPDPERLLLDTARHAPAHPRLFNHAVSWLAHYSNFVARHRLKRLALTELDADTRPALGLLLDLAIRHGAARDLRFAANACDHHASPRPLFDIHQTSESRRRLAESAACPEGRARGLWAPDPGVAPDALRPADWILKHNPTYRERAVRKGDLRTSILESLRNDAPDGTLGSEKKLAELVAANRAAVTASLDDLALEGVQLRRPDPSDRRRTQIALPTAAW